MAKYIEATEVVREEYSYTEWDKDLEMSFPRSKIEVTKNKIIINKDSVVCFRPYSQKGKETTKEIAVELANGSIINIEASFARFKRCFDID